jgi:hypothetical protein
LYEPTPKEEKNFCKPKKRIQHRSKSQFGSEMKESMYRDSIPVVQVSITSCSKHIIEIGSRHWKGLVQQKITLD